MVVYLSLRACVPLSFMRLNLFAFKLCPLLSRCEQDRCHGYGFLWGRWTLEAPGRDCARSCTHEEVNTPRSTQVQGPREEVRPLLLLFSVYYVVFPGLQSLIRVESGSIQQGKHRSFSLLSVYGVINAIPLLSYTVGWWPIYTTPGQRWDTLCHCST